MELYVEVGQLLLFACFQYIEKMYAIFDLVID